MAGAAGGWFFLNRAGPESPAAAQPATTGPGGDAGGEPTEESAPFEEPAQEPAQEPVPDPESDALATLDALAGRGLAEVSLNGQVVAQIASKYPGIHDEFQTTADGSHTFAATDILAEHEQLRSDPANGSARVVLLKSTDYGKRQVVNGRPLYVTFALGDFGNAADVSAWCDKRFAELSAPARKNQCAARTLRPPA